MLPDPPMFSRPVPPPTTFESYAGALPIRDHESDNNAMTSRRRSPRDTTSPYRLSFPIRRSQQHLHGISTSHPLSDSPQEHILRRKTPNGTVNAGYDGAPAQPFSPGPPPLKYMSLAASGSPRFDVRPSTPTQNESSIPHPALGFTQEIGWQIGTAVPPWLMLNRCLPFHSQDSWLPFHHNRPASSEQPSFDLDVYRPVLRAKEYNVRAESPTPLSSTGPFLFGQDTRQVGCNLRHATELHAKESQRSDKTHITSSAFMLRASGRFSQSDFREKTLARARQCHVNLLTHLWNNGRANPLKTTSSSCAANKPLVHTETMNTGSGSSRFPRESGIMSRSGLNAPEQESRSLQLGKNRVTGYNSRCNSQWQPSNFAGSLSLGVKSHRQAMTFSDVPPLINSNSLISSSPLINAMLTLQVLGGLCEESDWSWSDGMLVGGCLQYGLEHYEYALRWFARILELDASHVEAIANMAATLFCLNRHFEAEQLWIRAVKLRPSYLEAAEHLIGLWYKKRSEEAVEVISYVQRSLKIPSQTANDLNHTGNANNGSSGYRLPASENGRIMALIHAKGTMLYGLNHVEKASEAFEEAVMISIGRRFRGIHDLTRHIQFVLSPGELDTALGGYRDQQPCPSMLPPETARRTAQLIFAGDGDLPGLRCVHNESSKRAAVQTTSNSLLSLAKIFQDAISNGSADPILTRGSLGVGDILALYYLSLSLQESPSTANNVGILLSGLQQTSFAASQTFEPSLTHEILPGINPRSGMALALAYYNYGLRLDPKHVHLHTNLGSLLKDIGQLDLAIQMYERAVLCDGTFDIALTNLANAVKDKGRIIDAIAYYRRALRSNPGFAEAVCGLFTALNSICSWRGRGGALLASGGYDRWHVDSEGNLLDARVYGGAGGLAKRVVDIVAHQLQDASHWGQHILQEPVIRSLTLQLEQLCDDTSFQLDDAVRQWRGKPWEGSRFTRLVERATRVALRKQYLDVHVYGRECSGFSYVRLRLPSGLPVPMAPTILPFHTFTCPLAARDIRAIAQRNALRISCSTLRSPWLPSTLSPPPPPPSPQLNVGYLSSDFNNHPLAHLMQSVFGFHDPSLVRAFCYATTASDRSVHRQQIEREAPVFRDVSGWSPEKVIEQIGRDHIHILVNLNGYTRGARNELFAARPAPIQMSFMGFAGSLGAEWCDYILADTTAVPPHTLRPWRKNVSIEDVFRDNTECREGDWMYSENVIFCRNTFFCCDHAQSSAMDDEGMTWEMEQRRRWEMRRELFSALPDDTVIMANFNQLYKIEPTIFRSWLRILARVPNAILWLLRFPEPGERNLRATAEAWAGPEVANRLIFTDVAQKNEHISRARVCDLFLDTPECNAHTTAADVLWSSTPLLTLPRYPYKMCSRMAASILRGALPRSIEGRQVELELIVESEAQYEQMAVDLAGKLVYSETNDKSYREGRGRLMDIRQILWENKWRCALFNTRRWVGEVESAYKEAWRRWVEGVGGDIYL